MDCFKREHGLINSQNVIIALLMRLRFTKMDDKEKLLRLIEKEKHGVVLDLIANFLALKHKGPPSDVDCVRGIFEEATRGWIVAHMPKQVRLNLVFADTSSATVLYEHPLHVCMSYYCNSQGILYQKKDEMVRCPVHERHRAQVLSQQVVDGEQDTLEMRMARVYAESEYEALLVLCGVRVWRDASYGNTRGDDSTTSSAEDRVRQAEDLLEVARKNHAATLHAQSDAGPCTRQDSLSLDVDATASVETALKNKPVKPELDLANMAMCSSPAVPSPPHAQKTPSRTLHFPVA